MDRSRDLGIYGRISGLIQRENQSSMLSLDVVDEFGKPKICGGAGYLGVGSPMEGPRGRVGWTGGGWLGTGFGAAFARAR